MDYPEVVSRREWLVARRALLAKEKALTRLRDELAAERRRLPMVEIDKPYVFEGPRGPVLFRAAKIWSAKGEMPGLSVFLRDGRRVFHTYSTYQRGLDLFFNTYNLLDVTPLGRQERHGRMHAWIRHHDRYEPPELARHQLFT